MSGITPAVAVCAGLAAPRAMLATMRLLHVADRLSDRGGSYAWTAGVLEALAPDHDLRLVVGRDDGGPRPRCAVDVRPGLEGRGADEFSLDDVVAAFRPDVVHLHNVVNPAVLEWAARRPAVLTVQDHRFFCPGRGKLTLAGEPCRRPLTREACAPCFDDAAYFREVHSLTERRLVAARQLPVTVLSRYMREELVAAGVSPSRVHVVPPFVAPSAPPPAPSGTACVLFVGRLVEAKGVRDAVAAWRQSGVGLPLVFAGTGPLRGELEAMAAAGDAVEVLGWVDRSELPALYARARAVVMPSRWQEPFGIAGLEALAHCVPVAAWESGGVGEWHPGPGLVRWGDVEGLAAALRAAVGRRVAVPPRFDRDEAVGRLLSLYARLARAPSTARAPDRLPRELPPGAPRVE